MRQKNKFLPFFDTVNPGRVDTSPEVHQQIDEIIKQSVEDYANKPSNVLSERIEALQREWDTERILETNAAILCLVGLVLGGRFSRKWLGIPGVILGFLFQHAIRGWSRPMPLVRRLGLRTRQEIETEKTVLKFLRGDFDAACHLKNAKARVHAALNATTHHHN